MERLAIGDVVSVTFPFSDLSSSKVRPALVLALVEFDNYILCQITSKPYSSKIAIKLTDSDFIDGKLPTLSYIRPDKLFTSDISIIQKSFGQIKTKQIKNILSKVQLLFQQK
jgi:mRNA interferase MazF